MKKATILIFLLTFVFISYPVLAQWSSPKRLTWNFGNSEYSEIAVVSGNNVYIFWQDKTPGQFDIFFKKSTDSGTTWSALNRVTWDSRNSVGIDILVDSFNTLHLAWNNGTTSNYDIFYKKSTDGGSSWTSPKRLTWTTNDAVGAKMAIDSNNHIHMIYEVSISSLGDLFYKKSTNSGVNWSAAQRLTWNPGNSSWNDIAIDSNDDIHIIWGDETPGNYEIFHKKSTDGGANWSALSRLTWNSGNSTRPCIVVDSLDNIHIVWYDRTPGNYEIFYKKSTNGGTTWRVPKRLTWNTVYNRIPRIAVDSNDTLHLVYTDESTGSYEIIYRYSTDGGTTWSVNQRVTWTSTPSDYPRIAIGSFNTLHVSWTEDLANYEIFYKKKTAK